MHSTIIDCIKRKGVYMNSIKVDLQYELLHKNKIRILAFVMGLIMMLPIMSMVFGDGNHSKAAMSGVVIADKLNVRTGAGTDYSILVLDGSLVKLDKGTEIVILSEQDDWYYISCKFNNNEIKGYVSSEYVKVTEKSETSSTETDYMEGVVNTSKLNVRSGAGTNYSILLKDNVSVRLEKNTKVTVLSTAGEWYYIKALFNGKEVKGYVSSKYVDVTKTIGTTAQPTKTKNPQSTGKKVAPKKIWVGVRTRNINVGEKISVAPTGFAPKNCLDEVKYWVKDTSIVEVSDDGMLIGKKIGKTLVAVYSAHDKSVKTPIEIKVGKIPKKIWVGKRQRVVKVGETISVKPTGFAPKNSLDEVKYWVKDESVVGISKDGILTGKKAGTTLVAVYSTYDKSVKTSITITVAKVPQKIWVGNRTRTVEVDSTISVAPTGFAPQGAYDKVKYWIKDKSVVKISADGTLTGLKEGTTSIAVYSALNNKIKTTITVNVTPSTKQSEDDIYIKELRDKGFPESYTKALLELHKAHPTWEFQAFDTGLTWEEALNGEAKVGLNLIPKSKNISWLSMEKGAYNWATDKFTVFDGSSWVTASRAVVAHYMDPRNFLNEDRIFMFELLSYQEDAQNIDGVNSILKGTAMYDTTITYPDPEGSGKNVTSLYSEVFMKAAKYSMVSPYHLASRCKQEIVTGVNKLSSITSGTVAGYEGYYNYYNIGASDSAAVNGALHGGLNYAKNGSKSNATLNKANLIPWTDRYRAIVGGANFIGATYIQSGQNTIYLEKFNVTDSRTFYHQYMSNVQGAWSESVRIHNAYKTMEGYETMKIVFSIPVYKDMPDELAALPADEKNPNNWLKSLSVNNFSLTPSFNVSKDQEYSIIVEADTKEITINATTVNSLATVEGIGKVKVATGTNKLEIKVTAQNGDVRTYILKVVRPKA